PQHLHERPGARLLLERRRRDFGQRHELADESVLIAGDERRRLPERRTVDEGAHARVGGLRERCGDEEQHGRGGAHTRECSRGPCRPRGFAAAGPRITLGTMTRGSAAALVALGVSALAAQRTPLRSSVELTVVTATVRDENGKLVTGLPREAFEVFEDSAPVPISQFTNERVPLGLGLLLDISDSMFGRRIKDAEAAVEQFLTSLLDPADAFFVMTFNHEPRLLFGWKTAPDGVHEALASLKPTGATAIYDAVLAAIPYLQNRPRERAAIVLVTDG